MRGSCSVAVSLLLLTAARGGSEDRIEAVAVCPPSSSQDSSSRDREGARKAELPGGRRTIVTRQQVAREAEPELHRLSEIFTGPELKRRQEEVWRTILDHLVEQALLMQAAADARITVTDDEVRGQIRHHLSRLKISDEHRLSELLEMEGRTLRSLREDYRDQQLIQRYLDQVVKPSPPPSPGEVLRYYAEHVAEFATPQEVQFRQIVLSKAKFPDRAEMQAKLRELWTAIQSGADFGELARRHSDSAYAQEGGLFPYQPVDSLRGDLKDLVRSVSSGRTLAVQETAESFAIVRVDGVRQGSPRPSEEVQGEILERMRQADTDRRRCRVVHLLRQRAYVWTAGEPPPTAP